MAGGPATSRSCPGTATTVTRTAPGSSGGSSWTPAGGPGGTRTATWRSWWSGGQGGPVSRTGPVGSAWAPAGSPAPGFASSAIPTASSGRSSAATGRGRSGGTSCGSTAAATPTAPVAGRSLARWNGATGRGTVIGVIGGYEQGGYLESVSYSPRFGHAIRLLYRAAV